MITINGTSERDRLIGENLYTLFYGLDGDDTIIGGRGGSYMEGGEGADLLIGWYSDNDTVGYTKSSKGVYVDLEQGFGRNGEAEGDRYRDIENAVGSDHDDVLIGSSEDNFLRGGEGDDILDGAGGDDMLVGGAGNDELYGGDGHDTFRGGKGADYINGGDGVDTLDYRTENSSPYSGIYVDIQKNVAFGGDAQGDVISQIENVLGTLADDTLIGNELDNELVGDRGNDTLIGADGDDVLDGGYGDDLIIGGRGDDTILSGRGHDKLIGGSGADTFVFAGQTGTDTISDFEVGVDMIDLTRLGNGDTGYDPLFVGEHHGDTWIQIGSETIILDGVAADTITNDVFVDNWDFF